MAGQNLILTLMAKVILLNYVKYISWLYVYMQGHYTKERNVSSMQKTHKVQSWHSQFSPVVEKRPFFWQHSHTHFGFDSKYYLVQPKSDLLCSMRLHTIVALGQWEVNNATYSFSACSSSQGPALPIVRYPYASTVLPLLSSLTSHQRTRWKPTKTVAYWTLGIGTQCTGPKKPP